MTSGLTTPSTEQMIPDLNRGNETAPSTVRSTFSSVARTEDDSISDLHTQRLQVNEKTAWMPRSESDHTSGTDAT